MTLPNMSAKSTLDNAPFRKAVGEMQADLRALHDIAKKLGTIKITTDLSAAKDAQAETRRTKQALEDMVPTDLQRRLNGIFNGFGAGAADARASAGVFEAQAATLRAQLTGLSNAVRLTRAEFQSGVGEASPEEIAKVSAEMRRLKGEVEALQPEIKKTFGEWSNDAVKAANATRTAEATVAAVNGQISRLGLASQVKLGASAALAQFSPQAGLAANSLIGLARGYDQARLSSVFFEKQLTREKIGIDEGRKAVDQLSGAFNVMPNVTEEAFKVLLRNGYSLNQATEAMKLYAGSALAAGKDVGGSWSALADDVQRGSTVMSNQYGITANIISAQNQYAKQIGVTSSALTDQQKVEGFLVALRKESSQELQDAETILKGYAGSAGQANMELQRAGQEVGKNLMPLLTNGTRALVGFLDFFNQLPKPVRDTAMVLGVAAVAVGLLATPVSSLIGLYATLTTAQAASVVAENAAVAATTRLNVATAIKRVLLADVGVLYAKANSAAMLYSGGMHVAAGSTNVLTTSITTLGTALKGVMATASIWTVVALAAGAAGVLWGNAVKETTAVYEQADAANEAMFEKTMARVTELRKSGTELGRAQAQVLVLQQALLDAQQGPLVGVNALTGERIYGKPDEARIKQLQADLSKAKDNVTVLFTEAERRGERNLVLTKDQTDAVKELNKVLEGRKFDLSLTGMSDMGRDLAKLGKEFDDLREKFKKPFVVNGQLLDPAQTPALRNGLAGLDAQLAAEQAATRKRYADEAVKTAKESALAVQKAEVDAMKDGAPKRQALRKLEIDQINSDTAEKVKKLADFPKQQQQLESDAQKVIAAKRKAWAAEDATLARENAKRVQDAEKAARDARISSMADGLKKEEALRSAAVADLKASIAEQVRALAGNPEAQKGVQAAGDQQVASLVAQQARERAEAVKEANQKVLDSEKSTRDAVNAAMKDGAAKEEAIRAAALADLRADVKKRVEALKDYPAQQARVQAEGNAQILALEQKHTQERAKARTDAEKIVQEASRTARDAEIAAISDQAEKTRASREKEVEDYKKSVQDRITALKDFPDLQAKVLESARAQTAALEKKWAQEDEASAKERAQRIADAWEQVAQAQFNASQAGRSLGGSEYELELSRRLAAAKDNAVQIAQIEAQAVQDRARLATESAAAQYAEDQRRLYAAAVKASGDTKLSADERKSIWDAYYNDLNTLGDKYRADEMGRLKQTEEGTRAAAEAIAAARLSESNKPIQKSEALMQELQWSKDLSRSDAEILSINQQLSAEREKQINAYQMQLIGMGGVILNAEQRQQVEAKIASLQHDQTVSLKEQQDAQRQLVTSTLDRLEAEAKLAERKARTSADQVAAQQQQLAIAAARVRELDSQIAAEGREKERNDLIDQRFGLMGQIFDLQEKINAAPLENEKRVLDVYKAQAKAQLTLQGLGDNKAANAKLTTELAARDLRYANSRLAAARTEADQQSALIEQANARVALAQALTAQQQLQTVAVVKTLDATKEIRKQASEQLQSEALLGDAAEARAKALERLNSFGGNAIADAEKELAFTKERLRLMTGQLAETTNPANRADVLARQLQLIGQQIEQERKLYEAQQAHETLTQQLALAETSLSTALKSSATSMIKVETASRKVAESRSVLARAEQEYANARYLAQRIPGDASDQKFKDATDALTVAISNHRAAVAGLATEYRSVIGEMDGVRDAGERLKKIVYGDTTAPFGLEKELTRLDAILQRRDAAATTLQQAVTSGDKVAIQKATQELAVQEERYRKQAELLDKNGRKVALQGEDRIKSLVSKVDDLGIQYDRESVLLEGKARIADQESQNAIKLTAAADQFTATTERLVAALANTKGQLDTIWVDAQDAAAQAAANARVRGTAEGAQRSNAAPTPVAFTPTGLDQFAAKFGEVSATAIGKQLANLENAAKGRPKSGSSQSAGALPVPSTVPANHSFTLNVGGITINAPSSKATDIAGAVNKALDDRIQSAKRDKAWSQSKCDPKR